MCEAGLEEFTGEARLWQRRRRRGTGADSRREPPEASWPCRPRVRRRKWRDDGGILMAWLRRSLDRIVYRMPRRIATAAGKGAGEAARGNASVGRHVPPSVS
ncbi:hypothetical protein E2C01_029865 [Portunus trituberculatus]|uniref:Uncharacterized protein n=1 Tax=Portunus trituberculatus TaxID=210409 RepID=A0A5B7ET57_PORTR|nr:hypothetical protein [Portunus trituberculatus]